MRCVFNVCKSLFCSPLRNLSLAKIVFAGAGLAGALLPMPAPAATPGSGGFLENLGQLDDRVIFSTSTPGMAGFLTEDGLVIDAFEPTVSDGAEPIASDGADGSLVLSGPRSAGRQGHVVRIQFQGGQATPVPVGGTLLPGVLNFFEGADPASGHTGARRFAEVAYRDVWPGIDLVLRIAPDGIRYDTIVDQDADRTQIRFEYDGPDHVSDLDGAARLEIAVGALTHRLPIPGETSGGIWRGDAGASSPLAGECAMIDWVTFLGGTDEDGGISITSDASNRPLVTGLMLSSDFPTTPGAYSEELAGDWDIFVTKIEADGTALVWSTYIGGELFDSSTSCRDRGTHDFR
jgi:hypothetical protein